jgi:hypothetical protein
MMGGIYLCIFHLYALFKYSTCDNSLVPLYLTFWKYYFVILKYTIISAGVYYSIHYCLSKGLRDYSDETKNRIHKKVFFTICVLYLVYCYSRFSRDMKKACFRQQTDRFENFYDGVISLHQGLQPLHKPNEF